MAQTVQQAASSRSHREASTPSLWILNRWQDLLLFIATPLLIIPVIMLAQQHFTAEKIYLFVLTFGAGGHQLPGMLRAYGDRALFERFKTRFIVAPILLLAFCFAFAQWNLNGLAVVLLIWAFWHGLMQVYGFVRIYDAKAGSFGKLTARLDWLLCLTWFGLGLVLSQPRVADLLDNFYQAGGPLIAPALVGAVQNVWIAFTAVVTVAFVAHYIRQFAQGQAANPVKLLIMSTSFGFWWYSQVHINNIFLGLAMFEVFHDVQYLSIVWIFNRKRVAADPNVGKFTRYLFRPSKWMIAFYVGLCFVFAGMVLLGYAIGVKTASPWLYGLGTASAFLHYYFDGFIWKVREKSTRAGLGLAGGSNDVETVPGWILHGAKWLAFVAPACLLWYLEVHRHNPPVERYQNLTAISPDVAKFQFRLGAALKESGNNAGARDALQTAISLDPKLADAHLALGDVQRRMGNDAAAVESYEHGIEIGPVQPDAHVRLGLAYRRIKENDAAERAFRKALELRPEYVEAEFNLAMLLDSLGRTDEAIAYLRDATFVRPDFAQAKLALTRILNARETSTRITH